MRRRSSPALIALAALAWVGCLAPSSTIRRGPSSTRVPGGVDPNLRAERPTPAPTRVSPKPAAVPTDAPAGPVSPPVFLAPLPSPNDFNLLANGGFNANWYVGHNTCWVVALPPAPAGKVDRVFLGAKLGAMKTEPIPGRPAWERRPVPGEIDIAVAPQPLWPQNRRFFLTSTSEIPLAGDGDNALEGVGDARWFWVEIPAKALSTTGPNYVAVFSPSEKLRDEAHAPILAAGPAAVSDNVWLNTGVSGGPPLTTAEALKTPVASYEPAVAVKWISERGEGPRVSWVDGVRRASRLASPEALAARVEGADIVEAWLEMSVDDVVWKRVGEVSSGAPYQFTLWPDRLPTGTVRFRAVARDQWENRTVSPVVTRRVIR